MSHPHLAGSIVVAFAGHARSGKTSLASAVHARTGLPIARFGRDVERVAHERGLPLDTPDTRRATLMAVGKELVDTDPIGFCQRVLAQVGWRAGNSALIEGLRHVAIAQRLETLVAPSLFRVVLVTAPPDVRSARLAADGLLASDIRTRIDMHSTERDLARDLPELAALVVDGVRSTDESADTVVAAMRTWGWAPSADA